MGILITNTLILTMDDKNPIIKKGYVLIKDNCIEKVGNGEYDGERYDLKIIDGSNYCVMPGIINCHTHSSMTLLRGYGEGLPLMKWLNDKIWPMEAKFNNKHIRLGTELACVEMLRSGTTCFNDMYFYQKEVMDVAKKFNMRAILGLPIIGEDWNKQLKEADELLTYIEKDNSKLITGTYAPHSPYTLSKEALTNIAKEAKKTSRMIHTHVSETMDEVQIIKDKYNMTSCELLNELGIFNNKTVAAHCVHLSNNDISILKEKNVSVVYNPESNMKLSSGIARIVDMFNSNVNVCIGTDGASSNNNLNMFEEMQTGALLQKLWCKDPTVMDGYTMLKMATVNGAKALGIHNLGMIKKGYIADLIMINLNKANMVPIHDICSNLVFSANGSEVEYVIVNGKVLIDKGQLIGIDEEKIIYESNKFYKEFV